MGRLMLKDLTLKELEAWCLSTGETANRAMHLWRAMYADDNWIQSLEETVGRQGGFAQRYVEACSTTATLDGGLELKEVTRQAQGMPQVRPRSP